MLSDTAIRKAKQAEKPYKMADERGLHVLVRPTGAKLFQVRYGLPPILRTPGLAL